MKIIPITALIACLAGGLLNAQVTITETFESSTAGGATPPAGWSFVNVTGAPSYANSTTGQGSNGAGGSTGLAGQVSSTAFVDTNLAGGYLVHNTALSLSSPLTGTFDFRIVHESTFDDVTFMLGDIADGYDKTATLGTGAAGEFLTVKLTEASADGVSNSISNGYGRDQAVVSDRLGQLVTNNILLADDTWYRATVTWTPTSGTTGSFSIVISNFSTNLFTLALPNFTFASANGHIGFGSVNDTIRFDNVSFSGQSVQTVTVPNVAGLAQAAAQSDIVGAGLVVGSVTQQSSTTIPVGNVISQDPVGGASVPQGSSVNLAVSSGPPPPMTTVPNVVELAQAAAQSGIVGAGLVVGTVTQQFSETVPVGNVISQNPVGGTSVPEGSTVNLAVSSGWQPLTGTPIISLNQIGYQTTAPKRFTAPVAPDGQVFQIASAAAPATMLFSGTVNNGIGDFSGFQPVSAGPYVISYTPMPGSVVASHPFLIQPDLLEEKLVKPAIDFMIDARSGVGSHPSAYGGNPWRDGTYYSFEVPSLIYLHLNARQASNQKAGQINFHAEKATVLAPSFPYVVETGSGDFLNELRRFYNTYDAPLSGCPDALAAVHFGLGVTMAQLSGTKDPSGDPLPKHLHSQTREWFAWFLYAWPAIRDHFPDSFYQACRDFTFANWSASSGLGDTTLGNNQPSPLDIDPLWFPSSYGGHDKHPFKGRHAPGHSILPNLLLWQVALREGRGDAAIYLAAAQAQTQWIIDNLDWNDPRTTKGHRMSEYKMMTGLVHFLKNHPNEAPPGLAAKIEQWADVMISRSNNLWDFRRYELTDTDGDGIVDWTLPKQTFNWNEPGNLAGFPACALAAAWTLDHAPTKQQRLREMSQAAIDCLFGRNPLNTGSASRPELGPAFPDQETAWRPLYTTGICAYLETVRGSLSSGPGSEHFPYNPAGVKRHPEGWVNFNAAFNMGLSYLLADQSADPEPLAAPFPLVISEVLASPAGDPLAEFIELHNPGNEPVRLEGLAIAGDVTFTVPAATPDLAAGARCLIVRDPAAFYPAHGSGLPVIGTFSGDLDDAGAELKLGDVNGNLFLSLDHTALPSSPGHSQTLGNSGWRISADTNGSPGTTDSIPFPGNPAADDNQDGVPNLVHHAVTGLDRVFVPPEIDRTGAGVVVRVTRNIAADDTLLMLEWSDDLSEWRDAGTPEAVVPDGDRLVTWTFEWPVQPGLFFIRLKATR